MWYLIFVNCCDEASVSDIFYDERLAEAACDELNEDPELTSEEYYYVTDSWHGEISPLVYAED